MILLPKTENELFERIQKKDRDEQQVLNLVARSYKINRALNQVNVLLIGPSGAGKSETVNHLFDSSVCKNSTNSSCTRSTTERVVTSDSDILNIEGITLALIDTPGFADGSGRKQDARNLESINDFLKTHPSFSSAEKKIYPNIVLITLPAFSNRTCGPQSQLSKTLKTVELLNIDDRENPNVVIVFTHACSIPPRKYAERCQELTQIAIDSTMLHLGIKPEVAFIENCYEDCELEKDGNCWTILPDGVRQCYNLYQSMMKVLKNTDDALAIAAITHYFSKRAPLDDIKTVHEKHAKTDRNENLTQKENEYLEKLELIDSNPDVTEMQLLFDEYVIKIRDNIDKKKFPADARFLGAALIKNGLTTKNQVLDKTLTEISELVRPYIINNRQAEILAELFGIKRLQWPDVNLFVGNGYDIFSDKVKSTSSVFMFDEDERVDTRMGIRVPEGVRIELHNRKRTLFECFSSQEEYIINRLQKLGVSGMMNERFVGKVKPGFNIKPFENEESTDVNHCFLLENIRFALTVETRKAKFDERFVYAVKDLPTEYDPEDTSNKSKFVRFFDEWGHYVVIKAYGGGTVEGNFTCKKIDNSEYARREIEEQLKNCTSITSIEPLEVIYTNQLQSADLVWIGGDPFYQTHSLNELNPNTWNSWCDSLLQSPMMLDTEIELKIMHEIIQELAFRHRTDPAKRDLFKKKADVVYDAQTSILGEKFKTPVNRDEAGDIWFDYILATYRIPIGIILLGLLIVIGRVSM